MSSLAPQGFHSFSRYRYTFVNLTTHLEILLHIYKYEHTRTQTHTETQLHNSSVTSSNTLASRIESYSALSDSLLLCM